MLKTQYWNNKQNNSKEHNNKTINMLKTKLSRETIALMTIGFSVNMNNLKPLT